MFAHLGGALHEGSPRGPCGLMGCMRACGAALHHDHGLEHVPGRTRSVACLIGRWAWHAHECSWGSTPIPVFSPFVQNSICSKWLKTAMGFEQR